MKPATPNSVTHYKARLVAKGFSQRQRIDFDETFSPIVKYNTIRTVLSFVAANDLETSQLDIKTALLYGKKDKEIYLQQPEGYVEKGKRLYGLKQASRVWNHHFDSFPRKFGLHQSQADACLYIRHSGDEYAFVIIWVDNGLVRSNNGDLVKDFIDHLR